MLYGVAIGRFSPKKIQVPEGYDPQLINSDPYKMGYQKGARNIKIQKSLKWGYISLGAGLTGLIIYGVSSK
jgi:hypothetical protein